MLINLVEILSGYNFRKSGNDVWDDSPTSGADKMRNNKILIARLEEVGIDYGGFRPGLRP